MTALWKSRIGTGAAWLFTLGGTARFPVAPPVSVCTNEPAPTDIATCVSDADCATGATCTAVSAKGQAVGVCMF